MALMSSLAVAVADIGHFKAVNDTHGHLAGDAVLAAVSAAMRDLLRDCDLCGRFGGTEFALLLPRSTADQALKITELIRQGISRLTVPQDGTTAIQVTVSIGVAVPGGPRRTLDDLLAADHALYQAKSSGRNRVTVHADTRVPQGGRPLPLTNANRRPAGLARTHTGGGTWLPAQPAPGRRASPRSGAGPCPLLVRRHSL